MDGFMYNFKNIVGINKNRLRSKFEQVENNLKIDMPFETTGSFIKESREKIESISYLVPDIVEDVSTSLDIDKFIETEKKQSSIIKKYDNFLNNYFSNEECVDFKFITDIRTDFIISEVNICNISYKKLLDVQKLLEKGGFLVKTFLTNEDIEAKSWRFELQLDFSQIENRIEYNKQTEAFAN